MNNSQHVIYFLSLFFEIENSTKISDLTLGGIESIHRIASVLFSAALYIYDIMAVM